MCRELPFFTPGNWHEVDAAFADSTTVELKHFWHEAPQAALEPACVKTGWRDGKLWVFATLTDKDIFNTASQLNELTYQQGDTFEIFARDKRFAHYLELHVSPFNQRLQLRFARAGMIGEEIESIAQLPYVDEPIFQSWTDVSKSDKQWRVLASISFEQLAACQAVEAGAEWLVSFGRYDYTTGESEPVLSSTSNHQELDFHRQEEWKTLIFS